MTVETIFAFCSQCHRRYHLQGMDYRCRCGGLFSLSGTFPPLPADAISLGEAATPMLPYQADGQCIWLKLESSQPSGSFKDRGARYLVEQLRRWNVPTVVEDSSGNAGSALAAYTAAAGIHCRLYVPEGTAAVKLKQMQAYGAEIQTIPGSRDEAAAAVQAAATEFYYASHVYNPLFFAGVQSLAAEIRAQVGVPGTIIVPVGNGTLLLGLYYGFLNQGQELPQIIAVQTAAVNPVWRSFFQRPAQAPAPTVAQGIATAAPPRLAEIVAAIRASDGWVVSVSEAAIKHACEHWARRGIYVEVTAATALAAWDQVKETIRRHPVVIPITGSGLKNP